MLNSLSSSLAITNLHFYHFSAIVLSLFQNLWAWNSSSEVPGILISLPSICQWYLIDRVWNFRPSMLWWTFMNSYFLTGKALEHQCSSSLIDYIWDRLQRKINHVFSVNQATIHFHQQQTLLKPFESQMFSWAEIKLYCNNPPASWGRFESLETAASWSWDLFGPENECLVPLTLFLG